MTAPARRRMSIGELYLIVSAGGAALIALILVVAPARLTTGPALVVVYGIASRQTWGLAFGALALLCAAGAIRPTERRFVIVLTVVVACQTAWTVGLTAPAFTTDNAANLLAPAAWLQLAATSAIVTLSARRPLLPPAHPPGSR